jgi:hypothetical protein
MHVDLSDLSYRIQYSTVPIVCRAQFCDLEAQQAHHIDKEDNKMPSPLGAYRVPQEQQDYHAPQRDKPTPINYLNLGEVRPAQKLS